MIPVPYIFGKPFSTIKSNSMVTQYNRYKCMRAMGSFRKRSPILPHSCAKVENNGVDKSGICPKYCTENAQVVKREF